MNRWLVFLPLLPRIAVAGLILKWKRRKKS